MQDTARALLIHRACVAGVRAFSACSTEVVSVELGQLLFFAGKRSIFCAILSIRKMCIYLMQAMKLAGKMPVQADSF